MSERVFLDTNILIYADDLDAGAKRERAQNLLRAHMTSATAVFSTQVLQEFFAVATRKLGVLPEVARRKIELLARAEIVVVRADTIFAAIDLHRLHSLSFWDALIVTAAIASGCQRVLTEDMAHGTTIQGVRIENPFLEAAARSPTEA